MVTMQKAQTGSRVYGGASLSPNRGQVSNKGAQGYIQRELRNKNKIGTLRQGGRMVSPVGNDGKSDNRSTVAAQALKRKQAVAGPGGTLNPNNLKSSKQGLGKQGPGKQGKDKPPVGNEPTVPTVEVGDTGQLVLPYEDQYNTELLGFEQEYQNTVNQLNNEYQSSLLADTEALGQLDREQATGRSTLLNTNAARGTAFSSAYGTQLGALNTDIANQRGSISRAAQQRLEQMVTGQDLALQQKLQNNQNALLAYQQRLQEQAGTLGYGTAKEPVNSHVINPKPGKSNKPGKPKSGYGKPQKPGKPLPGSSFHKSRKGAAKLALQKRKGKK